MHKYMLVEKYRPKEFQEVIGLDPSIKALVNGSMPHFLFVGPPGTGKTTTARIIINKLKCSALTLNASDERGIQVIRDKIKSFAMTAGSDGKIKVVHLDEADKLTLDAQDALRGIMETYHSNCRFVLTGNYENKIIDALKSRCTPFKFTQPKAEDICKRVDEVCKSENIQISPEAIGKLVKKFYPDIRRCINKVQELQSLGREITEEDIKKEEVMAQEIMQLLVGKKFTEARTLVLNSTVEIEVLLEEIYEHVWADDAYETQFKAQIIELVADTYKWMSSVINKNILFDDFMLKVMKIC